ncbi:MAG: 30S ribosomal protein S3 [Elusimicrobia bacterium HGW-Elusimicrobia-1]|jgi:small subunit ribosomal protein S3|nr:MAG: 30S ribosomal protein S3 [Elusimicrobia bacterium HGW-Elusimicrobia-1]
MGQKVHPKSVRLGYIKDWDSRWFDLKNAPRWIEEDFKIRQLIKNKLYSAGISRIVIERMGSGKYLKIIIYTSRPGVIIGRQGQEIERLKIDLEELTGLRVDITVLEIKRAELDAQLVAESVAFAIERQIAYRRAMKKAIEKAIGSGAGGIKIKVSGRLAGAEIARTEWLLEGRLPLATFRADIDYGFAEARTKLGIIGVKAWIFKKELFRKSDADLMADVKAVDKNEIAAAVSTEPAVTPAAGKDEAGKKA